MTDMAVADLANRIETAQWDDALNTEAAAFFGWKLHDCWPNGAPRHEVIWTSPKHPNEAAPRPDFADLTTVAAHMPDRWNVIMMEDNTYDSAGWSVTLKGPEAGQFSFGFSHTMERAWLGAIVRAVGTEREKERTGR
jgi:hypothetical protein